MPATTRVHNRWAWQTHSLAQVFECLHPSSLIYVALDTPVLVRRSFVDATVDV